MRTAQKLFLQSCHDSREVITIRELNATWAAINSGKSNDLSWRAYKVTRVARKGSTCFH